MICLFSATLMWAQGITYSSVIAVVHVPNPGSNANFDFLASYDSRDGVDLTNTDAVLRGFNAAIAGAGSTGTIVVPPGTYWIDNRGGALTFTDFNGTIRLENGATLLFIDNTKEMLRFNGGSPHVFGLHAAYQTPPTQVTGIYGVIFNGTTDAVLEDATVKYSGAVGLQVIDSVRPKLHNIRVSNTLLEGVQIANCQDTQIDTLSTENTGDDGLAFVNYANDPDAAFTGGFATNINVRNAGGYGIKDAGQSDLQVTGFVVDGTSASGVISLSDQVFNTSIPDRVAFSNGIIKNAGTVAPLRDIRSGLEYGGVAGTKFSNIEVIGASVGGVPGVRGIAAQGTITLSNIRVRGGSASAPADGFDLAAGTLYASDCSSESASGMGFNLSGNVLKVSNLSAMNSSSTGFNFGGGTLTANNLSVINVSQADPQHRALWFSGTGLSMVNGLTVIDTQTIPTGYVIGSETSAQRGQLTGWLFELANKPPGVPANSILHVNIGDFLHFQQSTSAFETLWTTTLFFGYPTLP
jgi:hypothetical protein